MSQFVAMLLISSIGTIVLMVLSSAGALTLTRSALPRCSTSQHRSCTLALLSTPGVYEAEVSSTAIAGLVSTSAFLIAAGYIWWTVVIPQKRTEVALSKRDGEISEYLDDLRKAAEDGDKGFERWLMTDWLEKTPGSKKKAALPFLKKAKWNSGDNPILVAFGGILALVLAASIGERGALRSSMSPLIEERSSPISKIVPVAGAAENGVTYQRSKFRGLTYYDYPKKSKGPDDDSRQAVEVKEGSSVLLNVRGFLAGRNGWQFLDTFHSGTGEAIRLTGVGRKEGTSMIKGLEIGLLGDGESMAPMRKGEKRRLVISSSLGFKDRGQQPQPLNEGAQRRLFSTVLNPVRSGQETAAFSGESIVGQLVLDVECIRVKAG